MMRGNKSYVMVPVAVVIALQGIFHESRGAEKPGPRSEARRGPDSVDWAKPLAQDFVVVHQTRDLQDESKCVCVGSPDIIRLPSGRLVASMELWVKVTVHTLEAGFGEN